MKTIVTLLILCGLAYGGWTMWSGNASAGPPAFMTTTVGRGEIVETVSATGVVQPVTLVQVGSQITGRIDHIYVDFNDHVKAGQIICELDQVPWKARVAEDEANLAKANASKREVETRLNIAAKELERSRELAKDNYISQSELDKEAANYESLKASIDLANANVQQVQAALNVSLASLNYTTIVSPVDGVVINRNVDVGQTVSASLSAPVLFEIAESLDQVHVLASVGEADIGRINENQRVTFTVDAYPDDNFRGTVRQVRLSPTVQQNVVTYTVVVEAKNKANKLLPGMTANLQFEVGKSAPDALLVSNSALRFEPDAAWIAGGTTSAPPTASGRSERGSERSGGGERGGRGSSGSGERSGGGEREGGRVAKSKTQTKTLWLQGADGLRSIEVQVGISDRSFTEILSGDVKEGDAVVNGIRSGDAKDDGLVNPFQSNWNSRRR